MGAKRMKLTFSPEAKAEVKRWLGESCVEVQCTKCKKAMLVGKKLNTPDKVWVCSFECVGVKNV